MEGGPQKAEASVKTQPRDELGRWRHSPRPRRRWEVKGPDDSAEARWVAEQRTDIDWVIASHIRAEATAFNESLYCSHPAVVAITANTPARQTHVICDVIALALHSKLGEGLWITTWYCHVNIVSLACGNDNTTSIHVLYFLNCVCRNQRVD